MKPEILKIKTSELEGAALDWAVAKCEGVEMNGPYEVDWVFCVRESDGSDGDAIHEYSTDWAQGGPIIEREKITVVCAEGDYNPSKSGTPDCFDTYWVAEIGRLTSSEYYGPQGDCWGQAFTVDADCVTGPTPLIAAMRCLCRAKLGDEVDVPEELL